MTNTPSVAIARRKPTTIRRTASAGSSPPKNKGAKTMDAVAPNRKKSYHSRDVPA